MSIELLADEIRNQIAAGEVIENPSAVVKELVENALDAESTRIEVEVEDAGFSRISVRDDGKGIPVEELPKAPLRHATSKISAFDDLYHITSMGFRGEALASIFSVAKTRLISSPVNQNQAYEITWYDMQTPKEASGGSGTVVHVEELFYNTPARKKYLKNTSHEWRLIVEMLTRFALYYHHVAFRLSHNGNRVLDKPAFSEPLENLYYVLGRELRDKLFTLSYERKGIQVKGFLGKPALLSYKTGRQQYVFVNGRYVKSKIIKDAVYEGCGSNLMVGRHPFFVLWIDIDPEIIDVNVHPTKIEIRFEDERQIHDAVSEAVAGVFRSQEAFKPLEESDSEEYDTTLEESLSVSIDSRSGKGVPSYQSYFSLEQQRDLAVGEEELGFNPTEQVSPERGEVAAPEFTTPGPLAKELGEYRILGQLNRTYIVVETAKQLLLVDQHVAEEKYFFEYFKKTLGGKRPETQQLLSPVVLHLSAADMALYQENESVLQAIGFSCEAFGEQEVIIRGVPVTIRKQELDPHHLKDLLYDIMLTRQIRCVEEMEYAKIASMACRMAVMAGDQLTHSQMHRLVEQLKYLEQPFNCPHGRPTFITYSFYELDKRFKRIV